MADQVQHQPVVLVREVLENIAALRIEYGHCLGKVVPLGMGERK